MDFLLFQECQVKANDGKFRLRDLLAVPMQRVLKYHLLLKVSDLSTHRDKYIHTYVCMYKKSCIGVLKSHFDDFRNLSRKQMTVILREEV